MANFGARLAYPDMRAAQARPTTYRRPGAGPHRPAAAIPAPLRRLALGLRRTARRVALLWLEGHVRTSGAPWGAGWVAPVDAERPRAGAR